MRDESGVTMIELLTAMAITAVIGVVLSGAIVTGMRTTEQTRAQLIQTQERRLTTTHFVADVQSASTVATTSSCGTGSLLISLGWNEGTAATEVAYRRRTVQGAGRLSRAVCTDGGDATVIDLARELRPGAPAAAVSCAPAPCDSGTRRIELSVTQATEGSFEAIAVRRVS
jgi:type II secretory pathway pseudopilin PulG